MSRNFARGTDVVDLGDITEARFLTDSQWSVLCFWRPKNTATDDNGLIAKWGTSNNKQQFLLRQSTGTAPRPLQVLAAAAVKITGGNCQLDTWYCTCVTNDGGAAVGSLLLYTIAIDGTIIDDGAASTAAYSDKANLNERIAFGNDGGSPMDGDQAHQIYVLGEVTRDEWLAYFRDPIAMMPYLKEKYGIAYYEPLEGNASPEPDLSGKGNDGTVTGATKSDNPPVPGFGSRAPTMGVPSAGGGQVALGQVTETDTAQSVTTAAGAVSVALGQVTELDTAQPVTVSATAMVALGQVTELDTAQPVTPAAGASSVALGQVTEADTAQAVTPAAGVVSVVLGQVTEADTAQAVTTSSGQAVAVGQVAEADTAQPVTPAAGAASVAVGQVTEVDTAQAVTASSGQAVAVGQVIEADTAQPVTPQTGQVVALGQVVETDTAQAVTPLAGPITAALGQVLESDIAFAVTPAATAAVTVGQVTETDTAQAVAPLAGPASAPLGQVIEIDTAQPITVAGVLPLHAIRQLAAVWRATVNLKALWT